MIYSDFDKVERWELDGATKEELIDFIMRSKGANTYEDGIEEGKDQGYNDGFRDGFDEGKEEGLDQGKTEGYEKAKKEFSQPKA